VVFNTQACKSMRQTDPVLPAHANTGVSDAWLSCLRTYLGWTVSSHLVWEILQLPLYEIWVNDPLSSNVFAVVHCTGGDVIIAGASLALALVVVGRNGWPREGAWPVGVLACALGVLYTIYSEWLNTGVRATWAYSDSMPVVPWIGTGLSPLLQWLVLPPLGLWMCVRRTRRR
jgi:hypothetical protein